MYARTHTRMHAPISCVVLLWKAVECCGCLAFLLELTVDALCCNVHSTRKRLEPTTLSWYLEGYLVPLPAQCLVIWVNVAEVGTSGSLCSAVSGILVRCWPGHMCHLWPLWYALTLGSCVAAYLMLQNSSLLSELPGGLIYCLFAKQLLDYFN